MRNISLRFRITLLVGGLLVILTTVLTIFSILGANHYFVMPQLDESSYLEMNQDIDNSQYQENSTNVNADQSGTISTFIEATEAHRGFSFQSLIVSITLIVLGLILTYWILGRALRPLTNLSKTIHNINEHNLSKLIDMTSAGDEVQSLTASFNDMLKRLKNSFARQKRFSASAAHELKTPLTTMKTSLQVLGLEESPSIEDYKDTISVMEQNVEQLISTVNDLLLLSFEGKTELDDEISLRELFCEITQD